VRFLVDQQLPPALADWLRASGHHADHTERLGLGRSSDAVVWAYANQTGSVVVTKDGDFASMRRRSDGPQILWLRIGNASTTDVLTHVERRWLQTIEYLKAGEAIVEV
jgi:predicted nuclease of predicted toxin-antitoxin system